MKSTNYSDDLKFLLNAFTPASELNTVVPEVNDSVLDSQDTSLLLQTSSALQFSIPNVKLSYPEPFLASPSYMHTDLFFLHILQYWYWLWFLFIFLICFFFLTFLSTVRWCNMRTRPRRETRGVSRSKCGDLITACVPVTWAISIIVYESADATDLNDGFGTGEMTVGVRAYQWGWEYYYPRTIDLNYNVSPSYSSFIGNSIKYDSTTGQSLSSNRLWKLYQGKNTDKNLTPTNLLLLPNSSSTTFNLESFSSAGSDLARGEEAFIKSRQTSKTAFTDLYTNLTSSSKKFENLNSTFTTDTKFNSSNSFTSLKQTNLTSKLGASQTLPLDESSKNYLTSSFAVEPTSPTTSFTPNYGSDNPYSKLFTDSSKGLSQTNLSNHSVSGKDSDNSSFVNQINAVETGLKELSSGKGSFSQQSSRLPLNNLTKQNLEANFEDNKILGADQAPQSYTNLGSSDSHPNYSAPGSTISSNYLASNAKTSSQSLFTAYNDSSTSFVSRPLTAKLLSSSMFFSGNSPSVLSNSFALGSADLLTSTKQATLADLSTGKATLFKNRTTVSPLLNGPREKAPAILNSLYWSFFYQNPQPGLRLGTINSYNNKLNSLYAPYFDLYTEYDFNNSQGIMRLEDNLWEMSMPFEQTNDFLNVGAKPTSYAWEKANFNTLKKMFNQKVEQEASTDVQLPKKLSNSSDNYLFVPNFTNPILSTQSLPTLQFENLVTLQDASDNTESFSSLKNVLTWNANRNFFTTGTSLTSSYPNNSFLVLNSFRGDYQPATWQNFQDKTSARYQPMFSFNKLSNTPVLQFSAKNLTVNQSAFQKVFRSRFDEGRANVNTLAFAPIENKQQFLTDFGVSYNKMLRKNHDDFYSNLLFAKSYQTTSGALNSLIQSQKLPVYDFPFLLSNSSDVTRYSWIDWGSQWKYREVQPSSASRFSTLGVPYVRDPFNFNTNAGDSFQNTESYLTRISRSRRNYLPNWLFTPYFYNRFFVWNKLASVTSHLLNPANSGSSQREMLDQSSWYWTSVAAKDLSSSTLNYSFSGDRVYHKSTFRPQTSIQAYYTKLNALTDLLSKREFLYRNYFSKVYNSYAIPQNLTASPANPLIEDFKTSFLFIDPAQYTAESTKSTSYQSVNYFTPAYLKETLNVFQATPILGKLFKDFNFFSGSQIGQNTELLKNPHRPMRKGVMNMLRFHATAAIALPVEVRLQILASSRDVIHSWAVPSAGVKIDCIPGYTSHRIMTFLLTGIYWGQCQEICGRYHHWMPIVVYFMKRDIFFLWCTHFIFNNTSNRSMETVDSHFSNDYKNIATDKSVWLTELMLKS